MVDFKKRLNKKGMELLQDPIALYETLDRASDKGPLRPAQDAILKDWHTQHRDKHDLILKLHTGQGKTLIGLLILQSKLNEESGPVVYLCPNTFLIRQTCAQARQFGIRYCTSEGGLPDAFMDGKTILITSVQKLFNGLSRFGIGPQSLDISTVLMDDAHACIDAVRESLLIRIPQSEPAYKEIRDLFQLSLQNQGMGSYADICNRNPDAHLKVPYWDWHDKHGEVVRILAKHSLINCIKFAWPLLKDQVAGCQCVVSGAALEIAPYLPPLHLFGSYHRAKHRIFMSATVTNDAFLVKGLGLDPKTVQAPLIYEKEKWSGEKMVLIPSLINESLDRATIVAGFGKATEGRRGGVVVLAPSFERTKDWQAAGATVATKDNIDAEIETLRGGKWDQTLVIANRYDGIDLPDDVCRILIFDSKPHSESLIDRYEEGCRTSSEITAIRTARTIEQGLGRSVRGEKDYCVIVLTGPELIKSIRSKASRKYLSSQTRAQIDMGLEIADLAAEDIEKSSNPYEALQKLINQCLRRDPDWKAFYVEQMEAMPSSTIDVTALELFRREYEAEKKFHDGDIDGAIQALQALIDQLISEEGDKGWYIQEMARYKYLQSKVDSNALQVVAHHKNRYVLKPRDGMQVNKITVVSQRRMESILIWVKTFESFQEMSVALEDILSSLQFGVQADLFEQAFDGLASALGFAGQRPDKEWKEGPDNLWGLRDNEFLLVECKNEVLLNRKEINEDETEQMNRSHAWFTRYYSGANVTNVMVIPAHQITNDAALLPNVNLQVMDQYGLGKLTANVRQFFAEFKSMDFKDLSEIKVQSLVDAHHLTISDIVSAYTKPVKVRPRKMPE